MTAKAQRKRSRRRRTPISMEEVAEAGAVVIDPEPEPKEIDLDAIFGPPHLFPLADAIAKLCGQGEGWYYTTKVHRQSWCIEGALRQLDSMKMPLRIVFPRQGPTAMVAIAESADHHIGCARSSPEGVVLAPKTQAFTVSARRRIAQEFGPHGDPW